MLTGADGEREAHSAAQAGAVREERAAIHQMTEVDVRGRLLFSALASATAIGLITLGVFLWMQHWATA